MTIPPLRRYTRVFLDARTCLTAAGDARATLEVVVKGQSALTQHPSLGWQGVLPTAGTVADLLVEVGQGLAQHLHSPQPIFAVATSKGETECWRAQNLDPEAIRCSSPGMLAGVIAQRLGIGLHIPVVPAAACATSLHALIESADLLEHGLSDQALIVTADRSLQPLLLASYKTLGVISRGRPTAFLPESDGFAPGEAGAAMILSSTPKPWRLSGSILVSDGSHPTRCDDPAALFALLQGLWEILPEPDCIIAHATGTKVGDQYELGGLDAGPWRSAPRLVMKPIIGHTLGASGLVELIPALEGPYRRIWKLSLGFGGHIAGICAQKTPNLAP